MKKFRMYFEKEQQPNVYQLDNFITNIFDDRVWDRQRVEEYYIQSDYDAERYFRIKPTAEDLALITQENELVPGFTDLGSNEKFIINKIMKGKTNVTILVGTIGSGKTSTCWFVKNKISNLAYGKSNLNPFQIYINLRDLDEDVQHICRDDATIKSSFFELFNSMVELDIFQEHKEWMTLEYELVELWSRACEEKTSQLKAAFVKVVNELRAEGANEINELNYSQVLEKRKKIKQDIRKSGGHFYASYLLELLERIKIDKFGKPIWTVTIYIDGLDELSTHAQNIVSSSLIPLLSKYSLRSLIMMRMSTWERRRASDIFSANTDHIPHSGVKPVLAVINKLEMSRKADLKEHGIAIRDEASWHRHIDTLIKILKYGVDHPLRRTLLDLCGYSIRKAFKIAQFLLAAYEYSPETYLRNILIKRIMIAQNSSKCYSWSDVNAVENLFQLHDDNKFYPLLKIRMMSLLKNRADKDEGIQIADFCEHMGYYGYDSDSIRIALNELMHPYKRLLWCDSLLRFSTDESFLAAQNSKIFLSSFSEGYFQLVNDYEYFSEMIWDTEVPDLVFPNWEGRLYKSNFANFGPGYLNFLLLLFKIDLYETQKCVSVLGTKDFDNVYGYNQLITQPMIKSYLREIKRLIGSPSMTAKDAEELSKSHQNLDKLVNIGSLSQMLHELSVKKVGKYEYVIDYKHTF